MKKRSLAVLLLLTGCWDFDVARANCEDAGACRFDALDGGRDAAVEPEPERPGDVCETDAGIYCWEMPITGNFQYDHAAWDGQRLWVSASTGALASWDGRRWSGSIVSDGPVAVASTTTGVSFAVGTHFVAVDGGRREAAPRGVPLAAWADVYGRIVASCLDGKLRVFTDGWNGQWVESNVNFNSETPCTVASARLVGASRANLWLITPGDLYRYLGFATGGWGAVDAGPAGPLGHQWVDGCERDGVVYAVAGYETAHLQASSQQFFTNTGASALGCTNQGFTLANGGAIEQRTDLEVPGTPSTVGLTPRRLISPDGGALFAIGNGFASREGGQTEFTTQTSWPDGALVTGMAVAPDGGVYAVGWQGFVAKRTPRGWRTLSSNPAWRLTDITFDQQGVGYVAGTTSSFELRDDMLIPSWRFHRMDDGGVVAAETFTRVATLGDGTVIAVGVRGLIARLSPGAVDWEVVVPGLPNQRTFTALDARGDTALALNGSLVAVSSSGPAIVLGDAGTASSVSVRNRNDYFVADGRVVHHHVDGGVVDIAVPSVVEVAADDTSLWVVAGDYLASQRDEGWTVWGAQMGLQATTVLPTQNGVFVGGTGIARVRQ